MYETMTRLQLSSSAVFFALPQLEARTTSSSPAEQVTGRASQQPMTSRCLSDVPLETRHGKSAAEHSHATGEDGRSLPAAETGRNLGKKNSCPAPVTSKGGHRGALHAKAQAAEVLQQGEISVLSDVSLTSSKKVKGVVVLHKSKD